MKLLSLAGILLCGAEVASAGGISYTCTSNITSNSIDHGNMCSYLNNQIAGIYASLFTDAAASIYIEFGGSALGESFYGTNSVSYSQYLAGLVAGESSSMVDVDAVASLPSTPPSTLYPNSTANVTMTGALATALNLTSTANGMTSGLSACTVGTTGCYNGVITLEAGQNYYYRTGTFGSGAFDIFSIVEHETDEILGTASCVVDGNGVALYDGCGTNSAAPVDLFRYSGNGVRALFPTTNNAYFSYNGGVTNVANYNSAENGEDYADFSSVCTNVQDAVACQNKTLDISSDSGAEVKILDAIGYNTTAAVATPEPGSTALVGLGLGVLLGFRKRSRKPTR